MTITLQRADPLPVERPSGARRLMLRLLSLYPPFLGAGIRVRRLPGDPPGYETRLRLHFWNQNYYGAHFGGAIYTMCDPFYVLIADELVAEVEKVLSVRRRDPDGERLEATSKG